MAAASPPFRIAQAVGLTSSAWLSGNIAALSLISVPALAKSRDDISASVLAKQWQYMFEAGKSQNPLVAVAAATSFLYLAWAVTGSQAKRRRRLYGLAAFLTIAIVPWTILAMNDTNGKLIAKAGESLASNIVVKDEDVAALLGQWTTLNGVRSLFPLLGSAVAIVALFS